jgi:hypothetical protein
MVGMVKHHQDLIINKNDMKKTIIQNFPSKADAFEWVMFKMLDATVGCITTTQKFRDNDAIIGEDEDVIYVGIYNVEANV